MRLFISKATGQVIQVIREMIKVTVLINPLKGFFTSFPVNCTNAHVDY